MQWKRTIGWIFLGLILLVIIAVAGGYLYLRSNGFQQFALRKISEQADQAMGGRTQISRLDFSLSKLTAHLYGIVVHGSEAAGAPPLLQVDELTVGLKIKSVFRRQINLNEIVIRHPVVHLQVDRQGKNNIPQAPPSQSSGHTNIFDLAIGHLGLQNGEVDYNDKKTPVDADLYDLRTDVRFDPVGNRYSGAISYDKGVLRYLEYAAMPHSFSAKFNATPSLFSLESAVVKVASSTAILRAGVTNYSNPVVAGDYDIRIHTQDFAAMSSSAKAAGDISLSGKMHYKNATGLSFLQSLAISGQVGSDGLLVASAGSNAEIRKLKGTYDLANGSLRARGVEAEALGGRINADVDMKNLDTTPSSSVRTTMRSISLQAVQHAMRGQATPQAVVVSGNVDGTSDLSWIGSFSNLRARSDLTVTAAARSTDRASTANIPVNGSVHVIYDGASNVLTVRQTSLRIPSTTLTADGQVSKHSNLQIHGQADDLHQLAALAAAFSSNESTAPLVSGTATLSATVHGTVQKPQVSGQLSAQNLHVQGSEWRSAELSLDANPSQLRVSKGVLVNAKRGRASFDATVALRNWSYLPSDSIHANLAMEQMSVTDLQHLANLHYPVSGDLSANLSVNGSQLDPTGSGSFTVANARAYDEPIQTLSLNVRAANGSIVSTLNVAMPAGSASSTLTFTPKNKAYKVQFEAPSFVLQKVHALQAKNIAVNGTLSAKASGEGTLDDPQFSAVLELPKLEMRDKSIAGLKAEVRIANKRANLTLDSQVAQTSVRARGQVDLTGDYPIDASIDTGTIPLDVLFASVSNSVPEGFTGQTELHATIKGPLKDKTRLEAHLTVPTLNASYQQLQVGAAGPIRADYVGSTLTIQPAEIRGTGTSLQVQGSIPFAGNAAATLSAQGSVDVNILRIFSPDLQSSGTVVLDVHASGTPQAPLVQGQVHLQNIALITPDAPLGVDKLNGTLDVSNDRIQVSNMSGQVGGGQLSVGGSVVYRPNLQFNLAVQGKSVRLRYPEGLRTVLDSDLALTGNLQASSLNGRVLIDTLSFTPDFDLAKFSDQFGGNANTPSQPGFADTVSLAIGVQSKENLSATSSQVTVEGRVNLRVSGTAANPVITGRTDVNAGELFYRNVRYQLQRGIITFEDPNQTNPNLNVSVTAKVQQYDLTITLRGPLDRLTTSYSSDPPLATADIINLIAFGKTTSESAAASSGQSTDSMLASGAQSAIGGGISSGVQKLAGVSSLQIDPLIGGNSQNPSARIALQQRVTKNFLFTFSTDVSQPGNEMVQGEYQINKRWSVSMSRDQLGGVSVDGRYHTRF